MVGFFIQQKRRGSTHVLGVPWIHASIICVRVYYVSYLIFQVDRAARPRPMRDEIICVSSLRAPVCSCRAFIFSLYSLVFALVVLSRFLPQHVCLFLCVCVCGYEFLLHNYIFEKVTVEIEIGARSQCERRWDGVRMRRDAMQICRLHCLHRLRRPEARLFIHQPILVPDNWFSKTDTQNFRSKYAILKILAKISRFILKS